MIYVNLVSEFQYKAVVNFLHYSVIALKMKAVPNDYSVALLSQVSNSLFSHSFSQTGVAHLTVPSLTSCSPCDFFYLKKSKRKA